MNMNKGLDRTGLSVVLIVVEDSNMVSLGSRVSFRFGESDLAKV